MSISFRDAEIRARGHGRMRTEAVRRAADSRAVLHKIFQFPE
jgi:hypothetical protein